MPCIVSSEATGGKEILVSDACESFLQRVRQADPAMIVSEVWLERLDRVCTGERLVFLAGAPGTGKTRLLRSWAGFHCQSEGGTMLELTVPPGWTGPEDLLGHLLSEQARYESTHVLDFLLAAIRSPASSHVLLLDEADASPLGGWFATLSSSLASGRPLVLHQRPRCVAKARDEEGLANLICNSDCGSCFFVEGGEPPWKTEALARCVPPRLRIPENVTVLASLNRSACPEGFGGGILHRAPVLWTEGVELGRVQAFRDAVPSELRGRLEALEALLVRHGRDMGWRCAMALVEAAGGERSEEERRRGVDEVLAMWLISRFEERGWQTEGLNSDMASWLERQGAGYGLCRDCFERIVPQTTQKP